MPLAAHSYEATENELSEPAGSSLREMPEPRVLKSEVAVGQILIATPNETEFDVSY